MINMDDVHLQSIRVVRLDKVKFVFTEILKGLVTLDQPPLWAESKDVEAIRAAWKPDTKLADFVTSLAQRNIIVVDQAEIETKIKTAGLIPDDAKLVCLLLRGKTILGMRLDKAKAMFTEELKGRVALDQPPVWAEPKDVEAIRASWKPKTKVADFIASLAQRNIIVIDQAEIENKLTAGLSPDDANQVGLLLRGKTKLTCDNEIAKRLLAGDLPERIEVAGFWGNHGRLLNPDSKSILVPYRGQVLRFVGQGWPTAWKILTLEHGERKY